MTAIHRSQLELLRECVEREAPTHRALLSKVGETPLSTAEREELREAVAAELTDTGLDAKGGHNRRGIARDDLIDLLGHL